MSSLPVCGKIFERLIFNSLYKYLEDNKLAFDQVAINLAFDQVIHVYIRFCQLYINYIKLLMLTLHLKPEVYFLIYPRLIEESVMKG